MAHVPRNRYKPNNSKSVPPFLHFSLFTKKFQTSSSCYLLRSSHGLHHRLSSGNPSSGHDQAPAANMMTRSRSWEAASADPAEPIPKTPPLMRRELRRLASQHEDATPDATGQEQWRALWAWWAVHAVSNGLGRVAFDVYLPFSPDASPAHIAHLLAVGTVATVSSLTRRHCCWLAALQNNMASASVPRPCTYT